MRISKVNKNIKSDYEEMIDYSDTEEYIGELDTTQKDMVNKPSHYQGKFNMEVFDVIENFCWGLFGLNMFLFGNIVKYVLRFQKKDGIKDLKKARRNLDLLILRLERAEWKPGHLRNK